MFLIFTDPEYTNRLKIISKADITFPYSSNLTFSISKVSSFKAIRYFRVQATHRPSSISSNKKKKRQKRD